MKIAKGRGIVLLQNFREISVFSCIYFIFTFHNTGLVEDYGLVNFIPLNVESKEMMLNVKNNVDKANGYCFGPEERNVQAYMSSAYGVTDFEYSKTSEVREQYMDNDLDKRGKTAQIHCSMHTHCTSR